MRTLITSLPLNYLQCRLGQQADGLKVPIGIGKRIVRVQKRFAMKNGILKDDYIGAFDKLFDDDEVFSVGELNGEVLYLPGHTPDHIGYLIGCKSVVFQRKSFLLANYICNDQP